ncbi:MAG TPA: bifunctional phosphoribosylaminoimidazolecarboxamide formyltransferase/IMP cyclohydrolase [Tepidisphaeraceae bacterium]|nr:bifunctional phosphoribosylaminoimidazolecarboxamide formyltransferase/IMP cyclohydrolase [Tepidisphaeraceae bacterium]
MSDLVPVKRALLSVSDKTGLAEFATALVKEFGVELISTGGTAKFLRDAGLTVTDVSQVTGFPEMMDGRVKTLHPKIHGGLLALRDNAEHMKSANEHGIQPIDLVCINLYPFEQTISKPNVTFEEAIENIDIGGPSMVRSAAKNHRFVLVVTESGRYEKVLGDLRQHAGSTCGKHRLKQAQRAFAHTAAYDGKIAEYLATQVESKNSGTEVVGSLPPTLSINLRKQQELRYGENPHQKAALYVDVRPKEASVAYAKQLHGKELSYINLLDADAALAAVKEFKTPAACVVKHATPCGYAIGEDAATAFKRAYEGDPLAAFGGIVALNTVVDLACAQTITAIDKLLEVIVAPSFAADALELLRTRWKNVRLLEVGAVQGFGAGGFTGDYHMHVIAGGYLVQQRDFTGFDQSKFKIVSKRQPTPAEWTDLGLAWLAAKHLKSNAISLVSGGMMVGGGAGQQDRVNAARIAVAKAGERAKGSVCGSDAFFPFPDGPKLLLEAGITAIIHPGGSVRDQETLAVVDQAGAAMVLTGERHFKH